MFNTSNEETIAKIKYTIFLEKYFKEKSNCLRGLVFGRLERWGVQCEPWRSGSSWRTWRMCSSCPPWMTLTPP